MTRRKPDLIRTKKAVCSLCPGVCGIEVDCSGGSIVAVRGDPSHPLSRGYICEKGTALGELVSLSSKHRQPLLKGADGRFEEIAWNEAIRIAASRLQEAKERFGGRSVAFHVGQAGVHKEIWPMVERLSRVFGTPNFSTSGSMCHLVHVMAEHHTFGAAPLPDWTRSRLVILWGCNPVASLPSAGFGVRTDQQLIAVDPRTTELTRQATLHLRPRPGTDGALALAMLHVIVDEGLFDRKFAERWTVGFEALVRRLDRYGPQEMQELTWIDKGEIEAAARLYATAKPASILAGNAVELNPNGYQTLRAISALQALTGNLDIPGGARFVPPPDLDPMRTDVPSPRELAPSIGRDRHGLFTKFTGSAQANLYAAAVCDNKPYPLRALVVVASNPLLTWPDSTRVAELFERLDFSMVVDNTLTASARKADLFFPVPTFLARPELWTGAFSYGDPILGLGEPVLDDERPTDWQLFRALATELGLEHAFPWSSVEEWLETRLARAGTSLEELRRLPEGLRLEHWEERKFERTGFATPSGKVELASSFLERYGHDPLPLFDIPSQLAVETAPASEPYPFVLTTGARSVFYMHSRHREIRSLRRRLSEPTLEIHPDAAAAHGFKQGDKVAVVSRRGRVAVRLEFDGGRDPRILSLPHGWESVNANLLTDDSRLDPISGYPSCRSLVVRLEGIEG